MSEIDNGTQKSRGLAGQIVGRIIRARYILAIAVLALALVLVSGVSFPVLLFLGIVLLLAVAAFTPVQGPQEKQSSRSEGMEGGLSRISGERLAEQLPDPMILFDAGGMVLYANKAAREAFQPLTEDTVLYLRFRAPEMHGLIQGVIADGQPRAIDYFERLPLDRWYKAMAMALDAGAGKQASFVLLFRDQTEMRRIDRMRSDFIANASHELRTPLASLRGFIETLQGPARNDEAARDRFLQIMQKQAERMARLIDDLLSLSRLEMKAHIAVTQSVDLANVLNHVVDTLTPLANGLEVTIERQIPAGSVKVMGDRDELIQVFQNLLENACKYGQSGKRVIVRLEEDGNSAGRDVVASIQDFGPGIPSEHLPRLTERFYRVDVETSRAQKGTGLGLAIVKHILTRHRGRLVIRSQVGEGSTFVVRFNAPEGRS
ncbi:PAS domain-containing protein [Phyllobacterium salinisoli]|uniref:histidine kinase n=1 Tax=Phyllobacterium salinisoli TaxID=1899321 RepID=A0A368K5M0_9HYPH|nr:ATP-binding protein [Phyllobacterium salinisoli]RCS24686.1 PAS domain-containing protein [Phyllobacterium salinisoli]